MANQQDNGNGFRKIIGAIIAAVVIQALMIGGAMYRNNAVFEYRVVQAEKEYRELSRKLDNVLSSLADQKERQGLTAYEVKQIEGRVERIENRLRGHGSAYE